jgi:hypothetical protein
MNGEAIEVADILRSYGGQYQKQYPSGLVQARIIDDLTACRTAALGGHLRRCSECDHQEIAYNSCRNRHCPKCQRGKQADWMAKQQGHLLDVSYFHIVFTLPQPLSPLALQNKRLLYGLLMRGAADTLLRIARDPRHLGARIGFTSILHTWGQTLMHHPHVHCLVPGGGLSPDGKRWIAARPGFFLPVRVLSRVFRGNYLQELNRLYQQDKLTLQGRLENLRHPNQWAEFVGQLRRIEWVVYAKPPFGSAGQVVKYLARYTHRVAICNRRLASLDGGQVTFRYKDYRRGHSQALMRLPAVEFIRRFLLHSLPKGFVRIRHYGLLANRTRQQNLERCRQLIGHSTAEQPPADSTQTHPDCSGRSTPDWPCPKCRKGEMRFIELLPPVRAGPMVA